MPAPVHRLRKDEILKLAKGRCQHKHTYLDHYQCYLDENPDKQEKIGFWDIEATNLKADYGLMLSYCIKDGNSDKIYYDTLTPADIKSNTEDKRLIQQCVKDLQRFDKIVTFYGTGYDFPFTRARALIVGVEFPSFGTIKHRDLYYLMKSKFLLSSRRLENCCKQLLGTSEKTRIDAKYWRDAVRGDKKAMAYILDHNMKDVTDLEKLYHHTIEYGKTNNTSI